MCGYRRPLCAVLASLFVGAVVGDEAHAAIKVSVDADEQGQSELLIQTTGGRTNIISVRPFGSALVVLANAHRVRPGDGCERARTRRVAICQATFTRVRFDGGRGDDVVDFSALSIPTLVHGGDGDDAFVGAAASNTIEAGDGTDTVYGGSTTDRLDGNEGDDLLSGRAGNDTAVGGPGDDILLGGAGGRDVIVADPDDHVLDGSNIVAPGRAASVATANASVSVKGDATAIEVRLHVKNANPDKRIAICISTKSASGKKFKPYNAKAWPNRRDIVRVPKPNRASWTASVSVGRCGG